MKKYLAIGILLGLVLSVGFPMYHAMAWPPAGTDDLQITLKYGTNIAPQVCSGWTYAEGWDCVTVAGGDTGYQFRRNLASASNLTITPTSMTITAGTTYRVTYTSTITAGTMMTTLGGMNGTARSSATDTATDYTEFFTASTTGKLIFTAISTTVGTIDNIMVVPVTSIMSSASGPIVMKAALSNASTQTGLDFTITGTKAAGTMTAIRFNDSGSGGTRRVLAVNNGGTETASLTSAGALTLSGTTTTAGFRNTSMAFTSIAAASLNLGSTFFEVINVGSGTASTITLPSTLSQGLNCRIYHNNGTTGTTITAAGGYSINGAVSNTELDKAGEIMEIVGTSTGWSAAISNH